MRIKQTLLLLFLAAVLYESPRTFAQTTAPIEVRLLRNGDVLQMVSAGMKSGDIIVKIFTSGLNFDVFPPVLRDLKWRGVPDTVLLAMRSAPTGPPLLASAQKN